MKKTLFTAVLILLAAFITCQRSEQTVMLELQYPDGQVIIWEYEQTERTEEYKNDSLWRLDEISHSGTTVEEIINKLDSTFLIKHTNQIHSKILDPKTNTHCTRDTTEYVYSLQTADGRIFWIEGGEMPDSTTLKSYINKFKDLAAQYPSRPVSVGYTWTQTSKVELKDGRMNDVTTSYKIRDLTKHDGHNCAIIDFKSDQAYPIEMKLEGGKGILEGKGRRKTGGVLYHAYDVGIIIEFDLKSDMVSELVEKSESGEAKVIVKKKSNRSYKMTEHILPE
jgi:hypothetical protein